MGVHLTAFASFLKLDKFANIGSGSLELVRTDRKEMQEWTATIDVMGADGTTEMGKLNVVYREQSRTVWAVIWLIGGHAVAKLDMECEPARNLADIADARGKLNRRRRAQVPAFLPHWMFIDPTSGEFGKHFTDAERFPVKMKLQLALVRWCRDELNLHVQPEDVTPYRMIGGKREPLDSLRLFGDM